MFLISRGFLESRLDSFYYQPEIIELEEKVKNISQLKLRDFIISIAGGATPSKKDADKYYSDKENGVPFIRVQNLTVSGKLKLDNCVYINYSTHNGMLKRSQISENDLLVKITGVGRMCVSSVAPKDFEGNINQHLVVIKTKDKFTSDILSAYLNSDIGEKLASRRATGGTRPAVDYKALRSIPIIFKPEILEIIKNAYTQKKEKLKQAKDLLNSIDKYLFDELGITLPEKDNSLDNRIFKSSIKKLSGGRLDPNYISKIEYLYNQNWRYEKVSIKEMLTIPPQYGANEQAKAGNEKEDTRYIRITDIDEYGNLKKSNWKTAENVEPKYLLNYNDILFARSGSVGKAYIHKKINKPAIFAGYLIRFVVDESKILADYLFYFCNSLIYKYWIETIQRPAVQANINAEEYKSLLVPKPSMKIQTKIVKHIKDIRDKVNLLKEESEQELEKAKIEIEKILLNNE